MTGAALPSRAISTITATPLHSGTTVSYTHLKQLKPRDKITQKMTRDGAVEVNETQQTAERISSREADSDFSQPDSAAAERVIEHLDAAHTRKANKKEVKKEQEATASVSYTHLKPRFYCVTNPTKGVMKLWQFSAWKRTKVIRL